ncbi:right-handed parallel beta-helix repeat-containing protein [Hymenobacter sp. YC55]|uniref:right-handed parallel beta-helix repeat-containing protein n=1 Tax=Hymenobacter sp. YC55 TaxID=3034019 RepID=UPI0023FA2207|nr:right-handed parallel beta-helix repeat-containing protein [Hymenobacter sp. YC55]MDF7814241.1 right-handed parallel beta-helix repeat-containing protein [Hymenobacter sp. YC55]
MRLLVRTLPALLFVLPAVAQASVGPQLIQNSTFGKHPEVNATPYSIVAGTDLGNWTSAWAYTNTDVQPTGTAVSIQIGTSSTVALSQAAFPGDNSNGVPASTTWLYMRGTTAAASTANFWQQNVSVRPNTTYTFSCYVSNATAVGSTATNTPQLQFFIGGVQFGTTVTVANETTASGGDKWTRYSVSYTTSASQTALALALRNPRSTTVASGNEMAVTSISFRSDNAGAVNSRYSCDGQFYQIRQVVTTTAPVVSSTRLFNVDRTTGNAYTTVEQKDLGGTLNCLGYRPGDGLQYALTYVSNEVSSNNNAAGADRIDEYTEPMELHVIDRNGDVKSLGAVGNLPGNQWAGGVIDRAGYYYVVSQNYNSTADPTLLYRIDLNNIERGQPLVAERITLSGMPNTTANNAAYAMFDIAFNAKDGNLYGVDYANRVYKLVMSGTTATVTLVGATAIQATVDGALGTCFFDISGALYVYGNGTLGTANSGKFYIVDISTGAATLLSSIEPAVNSDGASCVTPDQSLDVVKEVVSISPVSATQFNIGFRIQVRNNGSIADPNVQVSDLLWNGTTTANAGTTFSGASNVTITGLTVTNSAAGSTLAANTTFNGRSGNAGMLTGSQTLAPGQGAVITFTAQVTFPTGGVPTIAQNNTAYATSTVASFVGYTLQNSTLVPPPDLLAQDASTNSAALPETPNADVASPSPIYYNTAIVGNVFEDINYGGGAGRSQADSNGEGVFQARVELYSATGAYVGATTTDAAGNYSFVNGINSITLAANTVYRVRVVNSSVKSNRPGSIAGLLPVQTFLNGDVNRVGGENPNESDYGNRTIALPLSADATNLTLEIQSITPTSGIGSVKTPVNGPVVGVDFGFNFDVVVNTNDSGQGSLRQFIINANTLGNDNLSQAYSGAIAGQEAAIFMLNNGTLTTAPAGLRAGMAAVSGYDAITKVFTITPATALPTISAANTTIDGARQAAITGNNIAAVAETTTGPEVVLNFNNVAGLLVTGGTTRIENLGLNNARGTSTTATTGILADGAGVTFSGAATAGSVLNMVTTAGNTTAGARLQSGATGVTVTNNVLNGSAAVGSVTGEGLVLAGASRNTISTNTLSNNNGFGLLLEAGQTNDENTISANILRNNGLGTSTEDAGLVIASGNNNLISQNIFSANAGTAVVAAAGTSSNRITQNSMSGNTGIGIDLMAAGSTGLNGDNVTRNDNTDADMGANGLLNFPVLTQAVTNGGNLIVTGYAPAGALVELFVADVTTDGFGEGRTYLTSWTEGSAQDTDRGQWGYSGLVSGVNQGEESVANRFTFAIPLTSLSPEQQAALGANARLTATATLLTTVNGLAVGNTSEFSGNTALLQNRPLPVELVRFSAVARNIDAQLTWVTASEKNSARFVVERSFTGDKFEAIGTVNGQGNSAEGHTYQFTDQQAATTTGTVAYYRLRQVDTDGTSSLSGVQVVRFASVASAIVAFPNPTVANTSLDLRSLPTGTCQIKVTDLTGRVVSVATGSTGQIYPLATAQLPRGSYLIIVLGMGQKKTCLLVKE